MTLQEAKTILIETIKWKKVEPPFDGRNPPHDIETYIRAINVGIEAIDHWLEQSHVKTE